MKTILSFAVLQSLKPSMLIASPFVSYRAARFASPLADTMAQSPAGKSQWLAKNNAASAVLKSALGPLSLNNVQWRAALSSYGAGAQSALGAVASVTVGLAKTAGQGLSQALSWLSGKLSISAYNNRKAFAQLPGEQAIPLSPLKLASEAGRMMADAYNVSKLAGKELEQLLLAQPNMSPLLAKIEAKQLQAELLADYKAIFADD